VSPRSYKHHFKRLQQTLDDIRCQHRRQADLRIDAQVSYNPRGPEYDQIGPAEKVTGYLLMLQEDLADRSYIPKRGDRITSVEGEVTSLWITHVFNAGHYPGHGATMRRAYFTDRRPGANLPAQG